MEIKLIEVRDRGTFICAMRVTSTGHVAGDRLRRRGGFSLDDASIIRALDGLRGATRPYD